MNGEGFAMFRWATLRWQEDMTVEFSKAYGKTYDCMSWADRTHTLRMVWTYMP